VDPRTGRLTASEIIDSQPLSRYQAGIVGLCALVVVFDGFDAQCIGFLAPPIAKSLDIPLKAFGPVFASGLIGLMISSMTAGPVADRWGRKWPFVACTFTFAIFALLTSRVTSFEQLVILRFLTGLGLGGAIPNAFALASEYAPKRLMSVSATTLSGAMPLGALSAGLISSVMLPKWGWQSVFYVGGILPLIVATILIALLPESVRFMGLRGDDPRKVAGIMARIAPELAVAPDHLLASHSDRRKDVPVKYLFTEGRAMGTLLLWIPYLMNLLLLYFIVSWLPALLRQNALPVSAGIAAISVFSLGGIIGSVGQSPLMTGFGSYPSLLSEFLFCAICIGLLAFSSASFPVMLSLVFVLGCSVQGAQAGLNALIIVFYPTPIRSTGMGWASAVGRIGSISGPVLGGILLTLSWSTRQIFLAAVVPALCAAGAVLLSKRLQGNSDLHLKPVDSGSVVNEEAKPNVVNSSVK
jgi:AAHS family 4-hydroxybenzoate transporter-like MFS transporter